jgi:hypothetical protein
MNDLAYTGSQKQVKRSGHQIGAIPDTKKENQGDQDANTCNKTDLVTMNPNLL